VPFVASSSQFSLAEMVRAPWKGSISISGSSGAAARAWYEETQMPLLAWSSLAGGFFSGRFTRDNLESFEGHYEQLCVESYAYEDNFRRLERAIALAETKVVTLPQIALAYVFSQPLDVFALVGCQSGEEFAANAAALDVRLTAEEIGWLELST
jgi:aryl-alcohol dehydrogenase-like predicted oxidoreductase